MEYSGKRDAFPMEEFKEEYSLLYQQEILKMVSLWKLMAM